LEVTESFYACDNCLTAAVWVYNLHTFPFCSSAVDSTAAARRIGEWQIIFYLGQ